MGVAVLVYSRVHASGSTEGCARRKHGPESPASGYTEPGVVAGGEKPLVIDVKFVAIPEYSAALPNRKWRIERFG